MGALVALAAAVVLGTAGGVRADPPVPLDGTDGPPPADAAQPAPPPQATTAAVTTTSAAPADGAPSTTTAPAAVAVASSPGCAPIGAVAILRPHQRPLVLSSAGGGLAYPADGSVLTATGLTVESGCTDRRPAGWKVRVQGVSLFGGAVTAASATLSQGGDAGSVSGLTVLGRPVQLSAGGSARIGNWGYVIAPDPTAPSRSAFEVELSADHDGLPAGTILFVPYAQVVVVAAPAARAAPEVPAATTTTTAAPTTTATTTTAAARPAATAAATTTEAAAPAAPLARDAAPSSARLDGTTPKRPKRRHKHVPRHKPGRQPLKVTPPLEAGPYVFPVAGPNAIYGDTYGGLRTDVPGGWHHGDDIFAPLGTPVVAVADGTINRVGWERLGGWRLWIRDRAGDQFYYAHLSGYTPIALSRGRVHRGDVIGFLGNTGDAFTTLPHLHFEIHPRSLLHLHYDGAVDPTTYLQSWPRPREIDPPDPVHPRLPRSPDWRHEATVNFRELLAARGITPVAVSVQEAAVTAARRPEPRLPVAPGAAVRAATFSRSAPPSAAAWAAAGAAVFGLMAVAAAVASFAWRRRPARPR